MAMTKGNNKVTAPEEQEPNQKFFWDRSGISLSRRVALQTPCKSELPFFAAGERHPVVTGSILFFHHSNTQR